MSLPRGGFSLRDRALRAVLGAALLLFAGIPWLMPPQESPFSPCLFRELTGVSCLTCGLTRSLHATVHADVLAGFGFHFFGPLLAAGLIFGAAVSFGEAATGTRMAAFGTPRGRKRALYGFLIAWLIYGVGRAVMQLAG